MEVGLVGLPGSGKTCLFNALTGAAVSGFSERPNVGVAKIPDQRLDVIAQYIPPQKIVPATLKVVDIPGVPTGDHHDVKKLNSFLEHVRLVDAIVHVVRCFDDGTGQMQPARNIDAVETELVLADLVVAEGARDKAAKLMRGADSDAKTRLAVLEKILPELNEGRPIRGLDSITREDRPILRSYGFMTAKPMLYVANVEETDVEGASAAAREVVAHAESAGSRAVVVSAKLEAELAELDKADRGEMLESMGLAEPALGPMARAAHAILGLTTFYTAGEKEVRAWTIPLGATAPEAAGAIHSDLQRGFIRAECFHVDELVELKSEKAIREAGKLRSEGKSYQMQDGDVVHFLFNV